MKCIKHISTLILLLICFQKVKSQSLAVGFNLQEDEYRRLQLLSKSDSLISFTIRPLLQGNWKVGNNIIQTDSTNNLTIRVLPFTVYQQFTSNHSYGFNDGSLIPSKGYQSLFTGGLYLEYKPLSIQIKPEIVYAQNTEFEEFPKDHFPIIWKWYYDYANNIDLPVKFGNRPYTKMNLGQSSIRLNYKDISFGISSENLWWGPGLRNSLVMTNSAPGFLHLTLNTRKPIETKIGSFEGQIIAGQLENSGFTPPDTTYLYQGTTLYQSKPDENRFLSGAVFTYQPKWVSGLFLGYARSSQNYFKNLKTVKDYLPLFRSFNSFNASENLNSADNYSSFFMRWLLKEDNAEVYFEFGRNDQSKSFMDFVKNPNYGKAQVFGFRKLFDLKNVRSGYIMTSVEFTQTSQSSTDIVRNAGGWYSDKNVRHGYTNQGQMLGAGIGPGGNLQSVDISWVRGLKLIGLQVERLEHNKDFYYYAYERSSDYRRNWVDLSITTKADWDYKNLILSTRLNYIKSFNYGWYLEQINSPQYFINGRDAKNIQAQLGLTYQF